jgi:nitrate/nitrite transport system permease protein
MPILRTLQFRAGLLSLLILLVFLGIWYCRHHGPQHWRCVHRHDSRADRIRQDDGQGGGHAKSGGFPTLGQMGTTVWGHLANPFYDNGPNDKGIAIQLAHSLGRVALGFGLACLVAIPLGFVIGMSPAAAPGVRPLHPGAQARSARWPGCRWRSTPSRTRRSAASS